MGQGFFFELVFILFVCAHDSDYMIIYATIVHAHQHIVCAQKKTLAQSIFRSRCVLTNKIHSLFDALGNPVEVILSPNQDYYLTCAQSLIEAVDPCSLIAHKTLTLNFHRHPQQSNYLPGQLLYLSKTLRSFYFAFLLPELNLI